MTKPPQFARHYRTGEWLALTWEPEQLREVAPVSANAVNPSSLDCLWLAPPIVDPQINGFAGVDFQQDTVKLEDLERAILALRKSGCYQCMIALITDDWDRLMNRLSRLKQFRDQSACLRSTIAGWHVEGPFLSAEPGYRGAHPKEWMRSPSPNQMRQLRDICQNDRVLVTVAPEVDGVQHAIREAVDLGMIVSLGHTNASTDQIQSAIDQGATGFTHLGNGCPRQLDRHDNILWRVLENKQLHVSLIHDGIHVSPSLFRLLHQAYSESHLFYTTDAMAAAGAVPGRYTLGPLSLEVREDRIVRMPGAENFAGSSLTPLEGVQRAASMLGTSWREVWHRCSIRPAAFIGLGLGFGFESTSPKSFVLLEETQAGTLRVVGGSPG